MCKVKRTPRLLLALMALLTFSIAFSVLSCRKNSHVKKDVASTYVSITDDCHNIDIMGYDAMPSFVKTLLGDVDSMTRAFCRIGEVVEKKYYIDGNNRAGITVIYDANEIYASHPTLHIEPLKPDCNKKFYVTAMDRTILVDFSNKESVKALNSLTPKLSSVVRYRHDTVPDFGRDINLSLEIDFPKPSVTHADGIAKWVVSKIPDLLFWNNETLTTGTRMGYSRTSDGGWIYSWNVHNHKQILKSVSFVYSSVIKDECGRIDSLYPMSVEGVLNLQARVFNSRLVTYQSYTMNNSGGAHGSIVERLLSFDHVHNSEVDFKYLFKTGLEEDILKILEEEASKTRKYKKMKPNIGGYIIEEDGKDKTTVQYNFPQPALAESGVVFSFMPCTISGFAQGSFHFTIPYDKIKHCLTGRGKWLVESMER